MDAWRLGERQGTSVGEVAYEVFGEGRPVVLVHGTPTRSYLWRNIVPALAEHRSVYVYDLLGYGESEKREGQDVSIAAQARLLKELVEAWRLEEPAIAGHDIGGGIVLRAQLLEGVRFSRVAILDAVVLGPWLSAPRSSSGTSASTRRPTRPCPTTYSGRSSRPTWGRLTVTLARTRSRPTSRRGGEKRVGEPSSGRPSRLRSGTPERSSPGSGLWRSLFLWCGARRMGGSTPR